MIGTVTQRILILGAGFGGLELASRLSEDLADEVEVTLIDRNDAFVFGFSKLDVIFGRQTMAEVSLAYRAIDKPGVTFRKETVTAIDPVARRVTTDGGSYEADILVVALGADLDPSATPGLVGTGYDFYSPDQAETVRDAIESFAGGNAVIAVLGEFFKCPPAPYEMAYLLHDALERRGIRGASTITLITPMPKPIPIAVDVSDDLVALLEARGIAHRHATRVDTIDSEAKVTRLQDGGEVPFDLFLAVPVHVAPPVVVDSGLTEEDGWIAVDQVTLVTKWPGVYAVGDITSAPVPRAGVIAEGEASTVADVLVHEITGGPEPAPFPGEVGS